MPAVNTIGTDNEPLTFDAANCMFSIGGATAFVAEHLTNLDVADATLKAKRLDALTKQVNAILGQHDRDKGIGKGAVDRRITEKEVATAIKAAQKAKKADE